MRLIDADKLQEILQNVANISNDKDVKYCLLELKAAINSCPTVDKDNYNQAILDVLEVIDDVKQEHKDKSLEINYGSFLWLEREIRKLIEEEERK